MAEVGSLLPLLRKLFSEHLSLRDEDGGDRIVLIGTKILGMAGQSNNVLNSTIYSEGLCVLAYPAVSVPTELCIPRKAAK